MRHSKLEDTKKLIEVISQSENYRQVLFGMGLKDYSDNYYTLKDQIKKHAIDISHFQLTWNGRRRAMEMTHAKIRTPLTDILEGKYPEYSTWTLKRRLVKANILQDKCSKCGQGNIWDNEPLSLQLDHIDGNRRNHKLINLRILCPNCHTQSSNFGGRNKKQLNSFL